MFTRLETHYFGHEREPRPFQSKMTLRFASLRDRVQPKKSNLSNADKYKDIFSSLISPERYEDLREFVIWYCSSQEHPIDPEEGWNVAMGKDSLLVQINDEEFMHIVDFIDRD